ncbi:MAG TPA: hypothetical protein VI094_02070 [Propionibacteriaceae bacterium]
MSSRVEQLPQLRRGGFRPRLEDVVHARIRDRRGDAVLERQRPGYPVAGLANAVQQDLLRIYVGATEQEVHHPRDHMLPVVPEGHTALEQHRLLARAVEDQDVVIPGHSACRYRRPDALHRTSLPLSDRLSDQ